MGKAVSLRLSVSRRSTLTDKGNLAEREILTKEISHTSNLVMNKTYLKYVLNNIYIYINLIKRAHKVSIKGVCNSIESPPL